MLFDVKNLTQHFLIQIIIIITTVHLDRVPTVPLLPEVELDSPKRPGLGSSGRKIVLKANFFEVNFPNTRLHHYSIDITPAKCPRSV